MGKNHSQLTNQDFKRYFRLCDQKVFLNARSLNIFWFNQIACCGADGPDDYLVLQQPLPTECRDTVTGNPFFHGCVDELTWFFEAKCAWIAALAMLVAFITVSVFFLSSEKLYKYKSVFQIYTVFM